MPFEKTINTPNGIIGIWGLSDSSRELAKQCTLSKADLERFNGFTSERRKKEFLATRILLKKLVPGNHKIIYNKWGKPALRDHSTNISISHSADFACMFISEKKIGIDVEQTTRMIDKIADRFLHRKEREFIAGLPANQQEAKILFWAAKEAIFKCTSKQAIEFNEQIFIDPFPLNSEGSFNGHLFLDGGTMKFKLHYTFFKDNVMVYCMEQ